MGKKSHKKEHKKKSSKKSKHKSSSSSDDQWVEKVEKNKNSSSVKQSFIKPKEEADNWMDFVCNTTVEIEKKDNSKNKEINDSKARMEKQGQSDRELNPYWKNGGNGLPPIKPLSNKGFLKPKVDDNDECSYTSNKTLNYTKTSYGRQSWKKHDHKDEKHYNERHYSEDRNNHHRNYDNEKEKYRDKRHREDDIEIKERRDKNHREYKKDKYRESSNEESYKSNDRKHKKETESKNHLIDKEPKDNADKPLTDSELNALAAKQIKAEIMGNTLLAEEYKQKLDAARNNTSLQNNVTNKTERKEELVVLTRTSSKGYSYPVNKQAQNDHINDKKKKREKVLTHEDGKRVRYFDDDDKYSLKSMFEKEMTSTAEDSNMEFVKLSRKVNARDDEDDVFVEHASEKRSAKNSEREIKRAINEHRRTEKILNSCRYCFDSEEMLKHLFIAKGEKCYLCLPSYKSLTEGHCLIVPIYHYACATDIDEDVWTEMQVFRKVLTSMFKDQDDDVIFFESAMHLNNMPHMVWNCVPVPIEIGDTAPIYFKKAILECETEWAINKKVVDLNNKDVRRAVPKSLPYFAVDFGMQGGYAHVIEDEKVFPNNFAEEIIGGMMDLDHNVWRKKQKEPIEDQLQKTTKFLEMWKEYDFTKK